MASCFTYSQFAAYYHTNPSLAANRQYYTLPALTTSYTNCTELVISLNEYNALISNTTTANNNATTANSNATTANNNATTANNNAQAANTLAQAAYDKASQALALAQAGGSSELSDSNILNINQADAITLSYAILGLFIIAFVGRQLRNALNDNHLEKESS